MNHAEIVIWRYEQFLLKICVNNTISSENKNKYEKRNRKVMKLVHSEKLRLRLRLRLNVPSQMANLQICGPLNCNSVKFGKR